MDVVRCVWGEREGGFGNGCLDAVLVDCVGGGGESVCKTDGFSSLEICLCGYVACEEETDAVQM